MIASSSHFLADSQHMGPEQFIVPILGHQVEVLLGPEG